MRLPCNYTCNLVALLVLAAAGAHPAGSNFAAAAPPATATENDAPQEAAEPTPHQAEAAAADEEGTAEQQDDASAFLRVQRDDLGQPKAMETAIVTYAAAGDKNRDVVVDLIGAVHVADATYYADLNKRFESYDVVLYELVAPEGTRIPKGGPKRGGSLLGSLQGGMKSLLDLEFQLEKIDYTKDNFVHADMSPEEFAKSMRDRGESFLQIILRSIGQSAAMQAQGQQTVSDVELLMALLSKDRAMRMKRLMARQFEDMENSLSVLQGPEGSTLITERNKKCFEVLQKQIDDGNRRIGIFYGAGHLPDMEKRLADDFGLTPLRTRWLVAWNLQGDKEPAGETPAEAVPAAESPADPQSQPKSDTPDDAGRKLKKAG